MGRKKRIVIFIFLGFFLFFALYRGVVVASDKYVVEPILEEGIDYLTSLFSTPPTLEKALSTFPPDAMRVAEYDSNNYDLISNHSYRKQHYVHSIRVQNGELDHMSVDLWIPQREKQTHQGVANLVTNFISRRIGSSPDMLYSDDPRLKYFAWAVQGEKGEKILLKATISCIGSADYGIRLFTKPIE